MVESQIQSYEQTARTSYGDTCEWTENGVRCGWDKAPCDVHYIDYQEHLLAEKVMRKQLNDPKFELPKNHKRENRCIICPNHHKVVHYLDLGLKILEFLPPRVQ